MFTSKLLSDKICEDDKRLIYRELENTIAVEILGHVYHFSNDEHKKFPEFLTSKCGIGYSLIRKATWPITIKVGYRFYDWYDLKFEWIASFQIQCPSIPPMIDNKIENELVLEVVQSATQHSDNVDIWKNGASGLVLNWKVEQEDSKSDPLWMPEYFVLNLNGSLGNRILDHWSSSYKFKLFQKTNGIILPKD